ncbi:hypothetical protein BH24ACT3_BH24ACT3_13270 [soil metagenome]
MTDQPPGTAGTFVLGLTIPAGAEPGRDPQTFEDVRQGSGSADADVEAQAGGALTADTTAIGGDPDSSPIGGLLRLVPQLFPSGLAYAQGVASVRSTDTLAAGTYEATATFTGAEGAESEAGDAVSDAAAFLSVTNPNAPAGECGPLAVDSTELPATPGPIVLQIDSR